MPDPTTMTTEPSKLLEDLRVLLERGGQFVLEQAPPLAKEIIWFSRINSTAQVLLAAILLWWLLKQVLPRVLKAFDAMKEPVLGLGGTAALLAGVPGCLIVGSIALEHAIMSWCAPRYFLLDYVLSTVAGCH